jgi:hypothetical protein
MILYAWIPRKMALREAIAAQAVILRPTSPGEAWRSLSYREYLAWRQAH